MIKKYILFVTAYIILIMFSSTTTASILTSNEGIYGRLQQISSFKNFIDRISQIIKYNHNSVSINNDENVEGEDLIDSDGPEEDVLLPNIVDVVGEITPDNEDEPVVEEDNLEMPPTIDIDGEEGATLNEDPIIDEEGEIGRTLDRVIEVITEINVKIGSMLEKIVEHTYASGTTESDGIVENIVDTVVVVGESGGTAENIIADNVVVTDYN